MDEDLDSLTHAQLLCEAKALRAGIRAHRDCTGHNLCWHHPDLWSLLPDATIPNVWVPTWPKFMDGCIRYRASLDRELVDAPRHDISFDAFQADANATPSGDKTA